MTGACLAALLAMLLLSCAKNPVPSNREAAPASAASESDIGRDADMQVREEMGIYTEKQDLRAYVQSVGKKLAARADGARMDFRFDIVDSPDVNAFALPGGHVYVTRGILARISSEDELAAVLAHEIGHVAARHLASQPSHATPQTAFSAFSPDEERAASELGAKYASRAGYDPRGAVELTKMLASLRTSEPSCVASWFASHPAASGPARVDPEPAATKPTGAAARAHRLKRDPYLQRIDGLRVGWWSPGGYLEGTRYVSLAQDYSIQVPDGWTAQPRSDRLVLARPGDGYRSEMSMQPNLRPGVSGDVATDYARRAPAEGFEVTRPVGHATLPAGEAALVTMRLKDDGSGARSVRKIFLVRFDRLYVLTFIVPEEKADETMDTFMKMTGSIKFLGPSDLTPPPEPRIALYTAKSRDTWESIAEARAGARSRGAALAAWNGREASEPPAAGMLIKIPPPTVFE